MKKFKVVYMDSTYRTVFVEADRFDVGLGYFYNIGPDYEERFVAYYRNIISVTAKE